tara:strand:- start:3775 stop:4083 length:309 start_codon:yes stop_codon:yes gene_type:complete
VYYVYVRYKKKENEMTEVTIKIRKPQIVIPTEKTIKFTAGNDEPAFGDIEMVFETFKGYEPDADFPNASLGEYGEVKCYDYGYYWEMGDIVKKWKDKIREAA